MQIIVKIKSELLNIYYFHPDHLGSSSYITNAAGVVPNTGILAIWGDLG
jgi:hypothetical protein